MKTVLFSRTFKRDMKRLERSERELTKLLKPVLSAFEQGGNLAKWLDHGLGAGWPKHRDLHLRPDLILVYTRPCPDSVKLVRLGNHANLELT
ncbi:type II toxin-antitoxin system mRNA interferase toxin, RelE/StbE family [Salmonella enterica]|nr:type II toxin-antitoxin system mRNA interferase toxin, RelE/StbE family [Salmonella enterica]EJD1942375.1 type II toxin-antitoxin system YafQ family toxin [Escherichia coli]EBJ6658273.1 type II toxin-antitoxin system mRNA interferase toxin, RelE/StbE family [Salmonella enterica]EBL0923885.1 type II toxin-antitoxin system mRNA interferase toxin, RelE/StbE family [Salmonella enterica]EHF0215253.1 type II toxin-antitoxin system mRNA interferase toxin, RelE/StbE family [Salmonella enterica]